MGNVFNLSQRDDKCLLPLYHHNPQYHLSQEIFGQKELVYNIIHMLPPKRVAKGQSSTCWVAHTHLTHSRFFVVEISGF